MEEWLAGAYPTGHEAWLLDELERRFGRRVSARAMYAKAWKMGLAKRPRDLPERAVRRVRWCREPEMDAWMRAHDAGQSPTDLSREFASAWGFPLSRTQVNLWRASNGRSRPNPNGGGRPRRPVGSEMAGTDGYVLVKVAEDPTVPQSKDNWRPKHVVVWEREHGPVPEGNVVVFADRDRRNFDPANLVAVPKRLMARLNGPGCPRWSDAATLRAAVAWCELRAGVCTAQAAAPRRCGVCGRTFAPPPESRIGPERNVRTCPECLAAGRKAPAERRGAFGTRTCSVCGREFEASRWNQRRCDGCIARHPKWGAELQRSVERRR